MSNPASGLTVWGKTTLLLTRFKLQHYCKTPSQDDLQRLALLAYKDVAIQPKTEKMGAKHQAIRGLKYKTPVFMEKTLSGVEY